MAECSRLKWRQVQPWQSVVESTRVQVESWQSYTKHPKSPLYEQDWVRTMLELVLCVFLSCSVPHLGAYLHFLTDFAHTQPEDEYTLVTYEVK